MTPIKTRKLLVMAGVYETPISNKIQSLYQEGKSIKKIQEITGLSAASVQRSAGKEIEIYYSDIPRLILIAKKKHHGLKPK